MNKQRKAPCPPDPTQHAASDLKEAGRRLKAACEALEVARSFIGGQDLDGQRFSPREALEVVNAALTRANKNPTVKSMQTGPVAILEKRTRRLRTEK